MKVEIITDAGKEEINFNGNTVMPWYINVLSIEHYPDKLVFRLLDKYQTKLSFGGQEPSLWILGVGKIPVPEGGEQQRIM
jgi:hypothetical protein